MAQINTMFRNSTYAVFETLGETIERGLLDAESYYELEEEEEVYAALDFDSTDHFYGRHPD